MLAAAALLAAGPALAACGSSSSGSSGSSGSGAGMPTVTMMVGGIDKQIYLPYKLADQLGFYKKYGVNMVLSTEQAGGVGAEDAMVSGQVDMAGAWYNHTVDFGLKGKQVEDIIQLSGAPGERIMCRNGANVHSGADIKGKTMGVTDLGSGTDTLTQFIAAKGGVKHSEYHTVAVGAGATAIAALQHGSADCVMTTQPTVQAIESQHIGYSAIDLARHHRVLGADAAGLLGAEHDVHAVLLVEAELVGQLVGQVDLLVDAADHQRDVLGGLRAAGGPGRRGRGARALRRGAGAQGGHAQRAGRGHDQHLLRGDHDNRLSGGEGRERRQLRRGRSRTASWAARPSAGARRAR